MSAAFIRNARCIVLFIALLLIQTACTTGLRDLQRFTDFQLIVESDRSQAQIGVPIHARFTVTNRGAQLIIVQSQDTPVMDIVVSESGSGAFLSWSSQNPDKISHRLEWKPGESKTIELTWTPKQGDVYIGYRRDIHFSGILTRDSKLIQAAGVTVCASDICR